MTPCGPCDLLRLFTRTDPRQMRVEPGEPLVDPVAEKGHLLGVALDRRVAHQLLADGRPALLVAFLGGGQIFDPGVQARADEGAIVLPLLELVPATLDVVLEGSFRP